MEMKGPDDTLGMCGMMHILRMFQDTFSLGGAYISFATSEKI